MDESVGRYSAALAVYQRDPVAWSIFYRELPIPVEAEYEKKC